jgi:hypothetical protein
MSITKVLSIAKTFTSIKINSLANGNSMTNKKTQTTK